MSILQKIFLFIFLFLNIQLSFAAEPAPASLTRLSLGYLGDSQSAAYNGLFKTLRPFLDLHFDKKATLAICGARVDHYTSEKQHPGSSGCQSHLSFADHQSFFKNGSGRTQHIDKITAGKDVVIIQLGDNHLQSTKGLQASIEKLVRPVLTTALLCVWIGPASVGSGPNGLGCTKQREEKRLVSRLIQDSLLKIEVNGRRCEFIDSFELTDRLQMQGDRMCIHYSDYRPWANAIQPKLEAAFASLKDRINKSQNSK